MTKATILVLLLIQTTYCYGQKKEEESVSESFNNYKSAILNDKGGEAVKYIDSRTIKYYSEILELVKNAASIKINSLSLLDKLMVFSIRHRTSKEDILSFDGMGLLVYSIESGMVGKTSVANNSIGEVTIDKDFAKRTIYSQWTESSILFSFLQRSGTMESRPNFYLFCFDYGPKKISWGE